MNNNQNLKWHQRPIIVVLLLIVFFPLGLYFMWKNRVWTITSRWVISIFFTLMVVANINKNKNNNIMTNNSISNTNSGQCNELDHSGNFRSVVTERLKSSGKIPQIVEFNGNGSYIFQAYDTEHSVDLSGTMTVNECGQIIDSNVSLSH